MAQSIHEEIHVQQFKKQREREHTQEQKEQKTWIKGKTVYLNDKKTVSMNDKKKRVNMHAYLKQQQTDKRMFAGISHYEKSVSHAQ